MKSKNDIYQLREAKTFYAGKNKATVMVGINDDRVVVGIETLEDSREYCMNLECARFLANAINRAYDEIYFDGDD